LASRPDILLFLLIVACLAAFPTPALAQEGPQPTPTVTGEETPIEAPNRVEVRPEARDDEIRQRLQDILIATEWYVNPEVGVQDGVVFLEGQTETQEFKKWAGDLARNTQDVVAVVNQIQVIEPPVWDFQPALAVLREQGRSLVRALPLIGFSLLILAIALGVAYLAAIAIRRFLRGRIASLLLANVIARGVALAVFVVGLYIVFQVAGLANVALTVLGGTGLLGLILGIAFQDITENFLASIFLSVQNPFRAGDLVEIAGITGFVQMLTTRATVLMTQDGNHVQIPNATVYKSNIHNYTSNPNRREDFVVGIGYEDSVSAAQEVALGVLAEHPAVLKEPEPWVLVESLGSATVNLRIYFWLDGSQYSWQKVKSSVIRLVKRAFEAEEISMPGEVRELLFGDRLPVQLYEATDEEAQRPLSPAAEEPATVSTGGEGELRSEAQEIEEQARRARAPEEGDNLLTLPPDD
jgi:small-conductance mechanosensitive channel